MAVMAGPRKTLVVLLVLASLLGPALGKAVGKEGDAKAQALAKKAGAILSSSSFASSSAGASSSAAASSAIEGVKERKSDEKEKTSQEKPEDSEPLSNNPKEGKLSTKGSPPGLKVPEGGKLVTPQKEPAEESKQEPKIEPTKGTAKETVDKPKADSLTDEKKEAEPVVTKPTEIKAKPADPPEAQEEADKKVIAETAGSYQKSTNSEEDPAKTNFFSYFVVLAVITIVAYLVFHNKKKIMGLIVEGRSGRQAGRRRSGGREYRKLDSNMEDVMEPGKDTNMREVIY